MLNYHGDINKEGPESEITMFNSNVKPLHLPSTMQPTV